MELPKYIVMKVDCEPKSTTVTITDISDRCDVIEYEAEQTEPQIIEQAKADLEKRSSWSKTYEAMCKTEPQTDIGTSDTVYSDTAGYVPRVDMTDCSWK